MAPITSHVRVETPAGLTEVGLASKLVMIGAFDKATVIVADAVELPASLDAVSVYVVVVPGDTLFDPVNETVPMAGSMEADVAPVTLHDNVAD